MTKCLAIFDLGGRSLAIKIIALVVLGYLIGSINGAIVISKYKYKKDVRLYGSKNAGMTNMLRVFGKKSAVETILIDFTKGVVCIAIARLMFRGIELNFDPANIIAIFAIIGHIFPIYFGFKGGKGILVALGMITVMNPFAMLFMLLTFIPLCFVTKIVSFSSIMGAGIYPFLTWFFRVYAGKPALIDVTLSFILSGMIIFMHRKNIVRLLNGTEPKFKGKDKESQKQEDERENLSQDAKEIQ